MKISIDRDADVLYISWSDEGGSAREVEPGIYLVYNRENQPVGLEVLDIGARSDDLLEQLNLSYAPAGSSEHDPPLAQEFTIGFSEPARR